MIKYFSILTLTFFCFQANSITCNEVLNLESRISNEFDKNDRTLGFEIEVFGNKIEELTKYLARSYKADDYTKPLKFTNLTDHPTYFKSYEVFLEDEVIKTYSIHGFSDENGSYIYSLHEDDNLNDDIAFSRDLNELFEIAEALLAEDYSQEMQSIEESEVYTWRVVINHAPTVLEERELVLHTQKERAFVTLFLEPEEANEALMGLAFQNKEQASSHIEDLIRKGVFVGETQISTGMGTVRVVPETSSNDLNQITYIGVEDFSSEIVLPPVKKAQLKTLLIPLRDLSEQDLLTADKNIHLATHLNVGYDPNDLIDLVEMMLKLNEEFEFFKNKYQKNSKRAFFAKALTKTQVEFLENLKNKGYTTKDDLKAYTKLHYLDTEDEPIQDKFFWLNILHVVNEDDENYRPALEIRISDAMLDPDQLEELADDVLRVISQD